SFCSAASCHHSRARRAFSSSEALPRPMLTNGGLHGRAELDDHLSSAGAAGRRHDGPCGVARARLAPAALRGARVRAVLFAGGRAQVMALALFLRTRGCALGFSLAALAVTGAAGSIFWSMREPEPIVAGPGVT